MKGILLVLFISISFLSFSQEEVKIPKGINKILLKTELNERDNLKLLLRGLKENDLNIERIDTIVYQVQTSQRNLKNKSLKTTTYTLNFNIYDGYISVTGRFSTNISISLYGVTSEVGNSDIVNKGMSGSPLRESFNEMNDLCLKIIGKEKIEYTFKN